MRKLTPDDEGITNKKGPEKGLFSYAEFRWQSHLHILPVLHIEDLGVLFQRSEQNEQPE